MFWLDGLPPVYVTTLLKLEAWCLVSLKRGTVEYDQEETEIWVQNKTWQRGFARQGGPLGALGLQEKKTGKPPS